MLPREEKGAPRLPRVGNMGRGGMGPNHGNGPMDGNVVVAGAVDGTVDGATDGVSC